MLFSFYSYLSIFLWAITLLLSLLVISSANPVFAVLALIAAFSTSALIVLIAGADFIAFIYILVYVGAVLILFLWVIMTMPIKRNMFLHFRFTFILLILITLFSIFFAYFNGSALIKVFTITPANPLFSTYVSFLKEHSNFSFFLRPRYASNYYLHLVSTLSEFSIKRAANLPIPKTSAIYDIFLIFESQKLLHPAPLDSSSLLYFYLKSFFYLNNPNLMSFPILKPYLFHRSITALNNQSFFIDLAQLANKNQFFLITNHHNNSKLISTLLPSFLNLNDFVFIPPALLKATLTSHVFQINPIFFNYMDSADWLIFLKPGNGSALIKLSELLYINFGFLLIVVGLILLVAMVGSVFLVKFQGLSTKKQLIFQQTQRDINLSN